MCPRSARLGALTGRGSNPARPARLAGHGHPGMRPCGARLRALIGKAGLARPARLAGEGWLCWPCSGKLTPPATASRDVPPGGPSEGSAGVGGVSVGTGCSTELPLLLLPLLSLLRLFLSTG
eukprot:scaffold52104_cov19-Tisochrysis_lutea.AAC.1